MTEPRPACIGYPFAWWFPTDAKRSDRRDTEGQAARAICRRCPVRDACLTEALSFESVGIWGGTDERERARMGRVA